MGLICIYAGQSYFYFYKMYYEVEKRDPIDVDRVSFTPGEIKLPSILFSINSAYYQLILRDSHLLLMR